MAVRSQLSSSIDMSWDSDFNEADIWNTTVDATSSFSSSRDVEFSKLAMLNKTKKTMKGPDWSKIILRVRDCKHDADDEGEIWFPPHVFLARQRRHDGMASFSVHEGVGRTLKGRDLSRLRDAIWKQTGFED